MRSFGRVRRNESEEIRLSLQEVNGELYVELRVYGRSKGKDGAYLPEPEALVVPVYVLPELCRALEETHDSLRHEGVVESPALENLITVDTGSSAFVEFAKEPPAVAETVSDHRVAVSLPFECYLLGAHSDTRRSQSIPGHVFGEVRILSRRDALVWLPEKFLPGNQLAVLIRIEELSFRGQAEIAEVAPQPRDGKYWHRVEWRSLTPRAEEVLSTIIDTAGAKA